MITLLDVNVLIALADSGHPHHATANQFFPQAQLGGWATCPITENGLLRIVGRQKANFDSYSPTLARTLLRGILAKSGHQFCSDEISLMDARIFPVLSASKHFTDIYLLGLAVKHEGRFATFDHNINASLTPRRTSGNHQILN
ncbi:MAG: TA system VapC family ribonuclease toxin [Puniceicoccaceae bacterium]